MTHEQYCWQQEIIEIFCGQYDPSYIPIYHEQWNGYEEWGGVFILEKDGKLYEQTCGYSVMSGEDEIWEPREISLEETLEIIEEWEVIVSEERNIL